MIWSRLDLLEQEKQAHEKTPQSLSDSDGKQSFDEAADDIFFVEDSETLAGVTGSPSWIHGGEEVH